MKRSEINAIIQLSKNFLNTMNFKLPPFAFWTPEEWKNRGGECRQIVEQQLGWDITDFGGGDFGKLGLAIFTVRNGTFKELEKENGKIYAEKILISQPGQITPTHFHYQKMEDIINRGGGELEIRFWNSTEEEKLAETDVTLSFDGIVRTFGAGETVYLKPGESVCIPSHIYHLFTGREGKGTVLIGEVSRVNDDYVDNRFLDPLGRFAEIEEDEAPLHLLYDDYKKYYRFI